MNGSRPSSRLSAGPLDDPPLNTHSQPQTSKRKATDINPLNAVNKRPRKEAPTRAALANKRKLNIEDQSSGLVIVRASSARPSSAQGNHSLHAQPVSQSQSRVLARPPSIQPDDSQGSIAGPSHPPAKRLKADGTSATRHTGRGKDRDVYTSNRADPEVDEDVRQMQSETASIRRQSEAAERSVTSVNPAFQFPASARRPSQPPPSAHRIHDTSQPIMAQESPLIERNRFMRGEVPHRRRSSVSRGKRISSSYEATGIISQPHTSVSDASFYKHIDADLPEPQRARQLLIWCSYRAMARVQDQIKQAASSRSKSSNSGKDPPPLSEEGMQLLKRVEQSVIKMLAEKKIDTNVFSPEGPPDQNPPKQMKENEQNVRNRAREQRFNALIQRSAAEEEAWAKLLHDYERLDAVDSAEVSRLRQELAASSEKSKGKRRASAEEVENWDIPESDLPEHFRGARNVQLARSVVLREGEAMSSVKKRLRDLEFTVDRLHALANSALETTRISQGDLDRRFALLNISLAARSQPPPPNPSSGPTLSSYLPLGVSRPQPTTDPQDLLRALSRIDAERPQAHVGDAARRAAMEVQRVRASSAVLERKLTDVAPPTPRKPPGTPRRATTPGRASTPGRGR